MPPAHHCPAGLPRSTILELLSSVSAIDLRHIPLTDAVPLLLLAAEARVGLELPVVQCSFKTVKRSFPRLRCAQGWGEGPREAAGLCS